MKNILTKFVDESSKKLLMNNELKIYQYLSNEERNNDSNGKILSLLKDIPSISPTVVLVW